MSAEDAMLPTESSGTRLTLDDFALFPDDGLRHELIDGEHFVTPSPNTRHQRLVQRLHIALANHLRSRPNQGEVFIAPFDVVLSFHDVVEPDLLLIAGDQEQILTPQNVKGAPALVVEVLSPGTMGRDEGIKRQLFERVGVREYWIVDPDRNRIRVFRRGPDESFPLAGDLAAEPPHRLRTPLLPGFSLRLDQLFRQGR